MKGIHSVTLKINHWEMGNIKTQQASTVVSWNKQYLENVLL